MESSIFGISIFEHIASNDWRVFCIAVEIFHIGTARESLISNVCDAAGDNHGGQTAAANVFATYCVPICFD